MDPLAELLAAKRGLSGPRRSFALAATCAFLACGGETKTKSAPSTGDGASGGAGASGGGGAGGTTSGGTAGAAEPNGGVANEPGSGAAAGDDAADAGESSGGAGGSCHDWCTAEAPACCSSELNCADSVPSCRLDVLAEQVSLPQSYADLQEEIIALSGDVAVSIPLTEVEHAAAEPPPMARFEMTLSAEASIAFADLANIELHPFRVSCDDQELFVGVGYTIYGAAAIDTPVLHVEEEDGAVALRIGAWQGVWLVGLGGGDMEQELRARLERAELRAAFCARGVLDTLE